MKKLAIFFLVVFFTALSSCQVGSEDRVVTIENRYSLVLPSFLSKASNLNDEASLQYQNRLKEFYVIVIDETKAELQKALEENELLEDYPNTLDTYSEFILINIEESMKVQYMSDIVDTTLHNMPAKTLTVNGRIDNIDLFYTIAFVEGKERYYQIMTWSLSKKQPEYKAMMKKLIASFNEL